MSLISRDLPAREWSMEVIDRMLSNDEGERKIAEMSMDDYVKHSNYEQAFTNQVWQNTPFKQEDLVPQTGTDQVVIMVEIEPDSAGAVQVDVDGDILPVFTPYGRRVEMTFQQVASQRIVKSQLELMGYRYNFRTVLTDLTALRMATIKDQVFIRGTEGCLAPSGQNLAFTGKPNQFNWPSNGFFSTERFLRSLNLMRHHQNSIEPATVLFNHLALGLIANAIRIDFQGTTVAADMFTTTNSQVKLPGFDGKAISTIKKTIVPNGKFYMYGPEGQVGRYTQLIEPTMAVKNEKLRVSMQQYEVYGMLFTNQAGIAATTFDAANLVAA